MYSLILPVLDLIKPQRVYAIPYKPTQFYQTPVDGQTSPTLVCTPPLQPFPFPFLNQLNAFKSTFLGFLGDFLVFLAFLDGDFFVLTFLIFRNALELGASTYIPGFPFLPTFFFDFDFGFLFVRVFFFAGVLRILASDVFLEWTPNPVIMTQPPSRE